MTNGNYKPSTNTEGQKPAQVDAATASEWVAEEREAIVNYLRKWDEIRQTSPLTRRLSSIIDSIEKGDHHYA